MATVVKKKDKFYTFATEFEAVNFCSPDDYLIDERGESYVMNDDLTFTRRDFNGN